MMLVTGWWLAAAWEPQRTVVGMTNPAHPAALASPLTPGEALDLLAASDRNVPNSELAAWLGISADAAPEDVLSRLHRGGYATWLDWDETTSSWWRNTSEDSPGARNMNPLDPRP
jgi:hypothetical protein